MNEGYYKAQILSAKPIKNRFGKSGFEIMFEVGLFAEDGLTAAGEAEVYLEISNEFGQPPMQDRTQKEISFQTLVSLGWIHGEDISKLPTLVNALCQVRCKNDSKGNNRFYFSNKKPIEELDMSVAQQLMAQLSGGGAAAPSAGVFNTTPGTSAFGPAPATNTTPGTSAFGPAPATNTNPFRR